MATNFRMGAVNRGEYDTPATNVQAPKDTVTSTSTSTMGGVGRGEYGTNIPAPMPTLEDYVSPDVVTGSDAAVNAALAAAAEAERIQKEIDTVGVEQYIAKSGATQSQVNSLTPSYKATDGTNFTDYQSYKDYQDYLDGKREARQSAFDLLYEQFSRYGLGSLVQPLRSLITDPSVSPAEFTIKLRDSDPYKARFAANAKRAAQGLRVLSEAEYLGLEDSYQEKLRQYGMPADYYAEVVDPKTGVKTQPNLEKFIAGDISPIELEDRLQLGFNRITQAAPEITDALKAFYPEITNGDMLAYVLDPKNAIEKLKRKVTAAEIGGAAKQFGLLGTKPDDLANYAARADELAGYGVTQAQARQGFQAIADILPRGSQLASIYKQEPYTQTTAESEIFGTPGAADARKRRERLTQLEQASFSGSSGTSSAIARDRAGAF